MATVKQLETALEKMYPLTTKSEKERALKIRKRILDLKKSKLKISSKSKKA